MHLRPDGMRGGKLLGEACYTMEMNWIRNSKCILFKGWKCPQHPANW